MAYTVRTQGQVPVKIWDDKGKVPVDEKALDQLDKISALPFLFKHIAVMPDAHVGKGSTIGTVIATQGALVPAAVGVDIGCGMSAIKTPFVKDDLGSLADLRSEIERRIPHGRTNNGREGDRGAWGKTPDPIQEIWEEYLGARFSKICVKYPNLIKSNSTRHLGTLGTGNHFVEVCLDEEDNVWVMLHSGSRGVGNAIGSTFIRLAKEEMSKYFIELTDADLAYFPQGTDLFVDYLDAVGWAQSYAGLNRRIMLKAALGALISHTETEDKKYDLNSGGRYVDCHHNYVAWEHHFGKNVLITRKGAVSARKNEYGIIPGSMGAKSFIVRGRGNSESFQSCSHGAGRLMSRTEARKKFSIEDLKESTVGIECRKDKEVLDETPGAYKSIDAVMAAQTDLVDIECTLKQIICVKG